MAGRLRCLAALAFVLGCCFGQAAAAPAPGAIEREMLELSNAFRARQGVSAVQAQPALSRAAEAFAQFMAQTDRYGHDADGRQPVQRAQAAGYAHCMLAENIAWQFNSLGFDRNTLAQAFVQGWIDSPPHRRNLLTPEATDIAIAVAQSPSTGRWYAVQMLGRPASLRTRFELGNRSRQSLQYRLDGRTYTLPPETRRWHEQCGALRVEVDLPGTGPPTVLRSEGNVRFEVDGSGQLLRLR